jgi:signal transduction histidine kinase
MPVGGQLRVNVQRFTPDPEWVARHPNSDHGLFVRLEFFDTGIGMTQEVMRQAFDAGFTTRPHGNGLGLHNVKRVVDTLGGVIEIESAPGRGTQFAITLPAKPAARVQ